MIKLTFTNSKHPVEVDAESYADAVRIASTDMGLSLDEIDLRYTRLNAADLTGVSMPGASCQYADMSKTDLSNANFCGADMRHANMSNATLTGAVFRDANLRYVKFNSAVLRAVDFRGADLRGADLCGADIRGADFRGAMLGYSCFPLWYGSAYGVRLDENQITMLLYFALSAGQYSDDPAIGALYRIPELINLVNQSQHALQYGEIQMRTQEDYDSF